MWADCDLAVFFMGHHFAAEFVRVLGEHRLGHDVVRRGRLGRPAAERGERSEQSTPPPTTREMPAAMACFVQLPHGALLKPNM